MGSEAGCWDVGGSRGPPSISVIRRDTGTIESKMSEVFPLVNSLNQNWIIFYHLMESLPPASLPFPRHASIVGEHFAQFWIERITHTLHLIPPYLEKLYYTLYQPRPYPVMVTHGTLLHGD